MIWGSIWGQFGWAFGGLFGRDDLGLGTMIHSLRGAGDRPPPNSPQTIPSNSPSNAPPKLPHRSPPSWGEH